MSQEKYIGMDVHQATISVAVMDASGKLIMECLLETKAATMVEFIQGLHGTLSLTFEEGTSAAWLHDLLKPHVSRLVVCDPRKAALLKDGNKSDRIDARKLAEMLRTNQLKPVYHGEHGIRTLKELGRSYLTITKDVTRSMNRIKALYRSWAVPCGGTSVYAPRHRAEWLAKIVNQEFGFEPNGCTSNSMVCNRCACKPDANSCGRATSMRRCSYFARFLPSVRFARPCWWHCYRHPTVSAASASSGPTAVSPWRLTIAASTAPCEVNCNATVSASPCAV